MLLKEIIATNSQGSTLTLPIDSEESDFVLKNVVGLGPVNASIATSSFSSLDGGHYQSSRRGTRNVVFDVGLDPDYGQTSVFALRNQLYAFFMTDTEVSLMFRLYDRFETDIASEFLEVVTTGRVESCEPNMFTKDPEVSISVICFSPDFVSPEITTLQFDTSVGIEREIDYKGTTPTGLLLTLDVDKPVTLSFSIELRGPDNVTEAIYITQTGLDLDFGDTLVFSTVPTEKYAKLIRGGVEYSFLNKMQSSSRWLTLRPGLNHLKYNVAVSPGIPYTLSYLTRYGGL